MEFIILILAAAAFLLIAVKVIAELSGSSFKTIKKKHCEYIYYASVAALIVFTLLVAIGVSFVQNISGVLVTLAVSAGVIIAISAFFPLRGVVGKKAKRLTEAGSFVVKAFVVTILVEAFLFNLPSMHMIGKTESPTELPLSPANMLGVIYDGERYEVFNDKARIEITDIDYPIHTLKFDLEMSPETPQVDVGVEFSDDAWEAIYAFGAGVKVLRKVENSGYMQCEFSGDVRALRIFFNIEDGQMLYLNGITANEKIPFEFSLLRVFVFMLTAVFVYLTLSSQTLKKPLRRNSNSFKTAAYIATAFIMVFAIFMVLLRQGIHYQDFMSTEGNQITKGLVDAFRQGNLHLDDIPSDELLALENPYDYSQRANANLNFKWDHLLYNGKYYSYYGIAPVLTLFLPYNLLTGYYFPTQVAVLLFSLIGIWFLTKTYIALLERKFPRLQCNMAFMGLLLVQFVSGIFFSIARPKFYEISISAGFMFVALGAFYLISSNIIGAGALSYTRIALSSVFFSLAVLSRPTTAVFSVAAVAFIAFKFFDLKKERKGHFRFLLTSLIPFAVFASIQMAYNYLRFGSVLDFGIQYSLTINDFTHADFHYKFVFILLFAYLFAFPYIVPKFPYVSSDFQRLSTNGYFFVDDGKIDALAIGIFFKALPMWSYFAIKPAYCLMPEKTRKRDMFLLILSCVVAPLIIIFSIWESGFAIRYTADIYWPLVLGALCIMFIIFSHQTPEKKKLSEVFLTASLIFSAFICFAQIYNFSHHTGASTEWRDFANYLKFTFEIFK